jgi:ubiquinol oxidase
VLHELRGQLVTTTRCLCTPGNGAKFRHEKCQHERLPGLQIDEKRYGCRAMMLETVAAVPGMVGGMLLHCQSLRRFEHSGGWIRALLEEAENERMHLMTFMEVANPAWYERALVFTVQGIFFNAYFLLYILSPRLAHRITGYLEEEAVYSYTQFLAEIDKGNIANVPAPPIAIDYWRLPKDATIRDVVTVVRADEAHHRDVNHFAAVSTKNPTIFFSSLNSYVNSFAAL